MIKITLDPAGREMITWPVIGVGDADALEASIDSDTWVSMTREAGITKVLVAGPDATNNPANTMVVPRGPSTVKIRYVSNPETVIRSNTQIVCS